VFVAAFLGWFLAQLLKIPVTAMRTGRFSWLPFVQPGGWPSSHSALCTALTTCIAMVHGLGSSLFPISLAFTVIVMYDGQGVRLHSGKQAQRINMIMEELWEGATAGESYKKLKEVIGHTPIEVASGGVLGVLIGYATALAMA